MADSKISALAALNASSMTDTMVAVLAESSATTNYKATLSNLYGGLIARGNPIYVYSGAGIRVGYTNILDALAALSAGNGLELGVGTFALGTTVANLPARVTISGAGAAGELCYGDTTKMGGSIITWAGTNAANGCAVCPGDYNVIRNLSIVGNDTTQSQAPFGTIYASGTPQQKGAVGVVVRDCYLFGSIDAVLATQTTGVQTVQYDFFDSIFESGFDTFNANGSTITMRQFNCITNINASYNPTPTICRCVSSGGATVEVFGGRLAILNGGPTRNSCVETASGTPSLITVTNAGLYVPSGATAPLHFKLFSGSTMRHTGCYTLDGTAFLATNNVNIIPSLNSGAPFVSQADPKDATAGNRPKATQAGQLAFYSGKLYVCTDASTPTWELVTSV